MQRRFSAHAMLIKAGMFSSRYSGLRILLLLCTSVILFNFVFHFMVAQVKADQAGVVQSGVSQAKQVEFSDTAEAVSDITRQRIVTHLGKLGFNKPIVTVFWHPQIRFYEIMDQDLRTYLLSKDMRYFFISDVYMFTEQHRIKNASDQRRALSRNQLLKAADQDAMVTFKPDQTRAVVYVFTDIDCPYCHRLHREIEQYLDYGIEIRYLAYPRAGVNSGSYDKAVNVWCSKGRQEAMTMAKAGQILASQSCDHPVDKHLVLGKRLGISGTPAMFAQGRLISGYLPAERLARFLKLI